MVYKRTLSIFNSTVKTIITTDPNAQCPHRTLSYYVRGLVPCETESEWTPKPIFPILQHSNRSQAPDLLVTVYLN